MQAVEVVVPAGVLCACNVLLHGRCALEQQPLQLRRVSGDVWRWRGRCGACAATITTTTTLRLALGLWVLASWC
jgi:hypothetical protein